MYRYLLNEDECEWVMGNVERKTDKYECNTRIEDLAVGVFSFKGGAQALTLSDVMPTFYHSALVLQRRITFHSPNSCHCQSRKAHENLVPMAFNSDGYPPNLNFDVVILVYGTEGAINLTTLDLQLLNSETRGQWERHVPEGMFYTVEQEGGRFEWLEGGAAQANGVADWAEGQEPYRSTGLGGYKALQMAHGVYESARMHERVMMPLQTRVNPLALMAESGHLAPERPGRYEIRANSLRGEEMYSDSAKGEYS